MVRSVVVYVYPVFGGGHDSCARRFAESYRRFRPDLPHRLVVVSNGGPPTPAMETAFSDVTVEWLVHDDSGWDIGAYRHAARTVQNCDLMIFFGGSAYVRGRGWLERMVASFEEHGEAVYGAMGSLGVNIHIRTTAFWLSPSLLGRYPYPTTSDRASRYDFEHGQKGLTMWALSIGLKAWMVTWTGSYEHRQWNGIPNGFHQGDQSALLAWDRVADPPYYVPTVAQTHAPPRAEAAVSARTEALSLVYIVRASSITEVAHRFFSAYRNLRTDAAHDLVIAAVGFESEAAMLVVKRSLWADLRPKPRVVLVPDPGFRLGVFREVCRHLSSEYVCLLDEESRPLVDGWLSKLYSCAARPGVGISGATGAHQSDPHIRDNVICMKRALYLEITEGATAADARALEAHKTLSLTRAIRGRGLQARVVGRSGDRDLTLARDGRTFWWGAQEELLVADDQTDDYTNGSEERRAYLRSAGWPQG